MKYTQETDLRDFCAWCGAVQTLDTLNKKGDTETIETYLSDIFSDTLPTKTDINDFLWFETDYIAELLGFASWEEYENSED